MMFCQACRAASTTARAVAARAPKTALKPSVSESALPRFDQSNVESSVLSSNTSIDRDARFVEKNRQAEPVLDLFRDLHPNQPMKNPSPCAGAPGGRLR